MKLRNIWLIILICVSAISIGINALVLSSLTNKYFENYLNNIYELNLEKITDYSETSLLDESISSNEMSDYLENYLEEPITGIKLYDSENNQVLYITQTYHAGRGMMGQIMGSNYDEINKFSIESDGKLIGTLEIEVQNIKKSSFVAASFRSSLFKNSLMSVAFATVLATITGIIISSRMSRSLKETANMATAIQLGEAPESKKSGIKEIKEIRDSLTELNTRLSLKQRARKSLTDELVHQTQTPLAILKSHIEAIEDGIIIADKNELKICAEQIDNISAIINNMSTLIDAGRDLDKINLETFEINHVLKKIVHGVSAQFIKKNIKIALTSSEEIQVTTDPFKLNQAVYNIITNAYKYTPENGKVTINYKYTDDDLIINIADSGIGIEKEDLDNIFNAYFRGSNTEGINGDGIGLFIVKENITKLGGQVSVTSIKDEGSTFTIKLPNIKFPPEV